VLAPKARLVVRLVTSIALADRSKATTNYHAQAITVLLSLAGKVCANEFLAHTSPRFYRGVAEENFAAADADGNGSLNLEEYKNTNYGVERVPDFKHDGYVEHFRDVDKDKDGVVTQEEYVEEAGRDHFTQMDYNEDGAISYEEFKKHKHTHYWSDKKGAVPDHADNTRAGFDQLDLNKDGKITREEETFALMPTEEQVQRARENPDDEDGAEDTGGADVGAED
jgi:hypothetical protein